MYDCKTLKITLKLNYPIETMSNFIVIDFLTFGLSNSFFTQPYPFIHLLQFLRTLYWIATDFHRTFFEIIETNKQFRQIKPMKLELHFQQFLTQFPALPLAVERLLF